MAAPPPTQPPRRGYLASLNRNVVLLLSGGAVANAPLGFVFLSMPLYLLRLGIGLPFIGLLFLVMGFVAVGLMIPFGILADRFGRRFILGLGGVMATLSLVVLAFADTRETFLLFAGFLGVAEALYFSTWNALLADVSTKETQTTVFGISFFVAAVSQGVGALIGVLADQAILAGATPRAAYQPLFLGLALGLLVIPLLLPFVRVPQREAPAGPRSLLPQRSKGVIGRFFAATFLVGLGAGLIIPLFSAWFEKQFGVGETFTGPLFAISHVVNAFAFLLAPRYAQRVGMIPAVVGAQGAATVVLLSIPFAAVTLPVTFALGVVGVLYVIRNALMNMTWPVMSSFLMATVHPDERSSASAITGVAFRLPNSGAAPVGGYLLDVNLSLPFYLTSLLYALGTTLFWFFFRGQDIPEREGERPALAD